MSFEGNMQNNFFKKLKKRISALMGYLSVANVTSESRKNCFSGLEMQNQTKHNKNHCLQINLGIRPGRGRNHSNSSPHKCFSCWEASLACMSLGAPGSGVREPLHVGATWTEGCKSKTRKGR